jgi:hypothetical protein
MRLLRTEVLIERGPFARSRLRHKIEAELAEAIGAVVWPPGNDRFTICPECGRGRGEGNGVKPIKEACQLLLRDRYGWKLEQRLRIGPGAGPGKLDAVRDTPHGPFAMEWETGNISSSHRALNKMALGIIEGSLAGGALVVPSRRLYRFLTDRVGNVKELEPYFPLWRHVLAGDGVMLVVVVEHDDEDADVPRIAKGTDGRALL